MNEIFSSEFLDWNLFESYQLLPYHYGNSSWLIIVVPSLSFLSPNSAFVNFLIFPYFYPFIFLSLITLFGSVIKCIPSITNLMSLFIIFPANTNNRWIWLAFYNFRDHFGILLMLGIRLTQFDDFRDPIDCLLDSHKNNNDDKSNRAQLQKWCDGCVP